MPSHSHAIKQIPSSKGHTFIFTALFTLCLTPSLTLFHTWPHMIICSPSIMNFGCCRMDLSLPGLSSSNSFACIVTSLLLVSQCVQVVLLLLPKQVSLLISFRQLAIGALKPGASMSTKTLSSYRHSFSHLHDFFFHSLPSLCSPLLFQKKKKKKILISR